MEDHPLGGARRKVSAHSHLQDRLQLLQLGFLLLDFTVVVLAQFNQQETGDVQHFLSTQEVTSPLSCGLDQRENVMVGGDSPPAAALASSASAFQICSLRISQTGQKI